jgi:hypothetical protein
MSFTPHVIKASQTYETMNALMIKVNAHSY